MICRSCGNEIRDDARFCPHCGAVNGSSGTTGYTGPEAPVPGAGKGKKGLLIGLAVVLAVVVIGAAAAVSGLFSNPQKELEKAMEKTLAAYAKAEEAIGLPDLDALVLGRSYSQRMSMELTHITDDFTPYELSALEGLGLRMSSDLDWESRDMDFELAAYWDDLDILSLQMAAEDNKIYIASPEFTEGAFYGVNTETLGADLTAMGVDDVGDVSFNLFDLMDTLLPEDQTQTMEQKLADAGKALWEAARVEKDSKETISVNGQSVNAQGYRVVIPLRALKSFADALADAVSSVDYAAFYQTMFQAAGLSQWEIDDIMGQVGAMDPYADLGDALQEVVDALGDVRLMVYVSGGYVSAVQYEDRVQGSTVKLALYLGGGAEYVDDLSLELEIDGTRVTVKSTGDHGGRDGAFTDKTTARVGLTQLTSDFRYDPGDGGLDWSMSISGAGSLDMEGTLTAGADSIDLRLEDISVKVMGMDILSLSMDYYLGPWNGGTALSAPKLITEMNGLELMALMANVQINAQSWLDDTQRLFTDRLPPELLSGMLY